MFLSLPLRATFVADTNFVSGTQKMFLILFRNIFYVQQMFPSLPNPRNIMGNNVSSFTRAFRTTFISYLLRFSDRIDRMKNSYVNLFIQSQSWIDFLTRGKSCFIQSEISRQNESVSSQTRSRCFLAPLHSSFTEVWRVSTSLLKFSRQFAINHRQSSNRFIALDKPIKKYIQEEQHKKTWTKTRWDARLACLTNFSTEGRGKKSFKKANMP